MGPAGLSHANCQRHAGRSCRSSPRSRRNMPASRHCTSTGTCGSQRARFPTTSWTRSSCTRSIPRTLIIARRSSLLSPMQTIQHGRGGVAEDHRGFQRGHPGRPGPSAHTEKTAIDAGPADARGVETAAGRGQHALVRRIFEKFPTEDVSGEILQTVRQVQKTYEELEAKRKAIDGACQALIPQVQQRRPRGAGHGAARDGAGPKP